VLHQLQEEAVPAEDVLVRRGRLERLGWLAQPQPGLHLTGRAAGGGDDPLGVPGDQLTVHPRLVVEAFDAGQARQLEQVAQALGVLGQHGHVRVRAVGRDVVGPVARSAPEHRLLVEPVLRREIGLDADDRLHAGRPGLLVEAERAEHVAVVGHRDGGHAQAGGLGEQRLELGCAVEHRVLRVHVEVHEPIACHGPLVLIERRLGGCREPDEPNPDL
jgi:hypothetical protein